MSTDRSAGHDVVVIGASMGGLDALKEVVRQLPADFPAALLVVLHASPASPGDFADAVGRAGPLPARLARDGDLVLPGQILFAPPGRHLLVTRDGLRLSTGPRENRARPSADPLFRSAAVRYRSRVIGVVLSGLLDDGAAGLRAIERCGGLAVVEDPGGAAHPAMPLAAQEAAQSARVVPLAEMGSVISELVFTPPSDPPPVPPDLLAETSLTEHDCDGSDILDAYGARVPVSCPDCGGAMWELHDGQTRRYRCHIGHAYSESGLVNGQDVETERALLVALRTMEERARMLRRMASEDSSAGRAWSAKGYDERAAEVEQHAETVRALLIRTAQQPSGR